MFTVTRFLSRDSRMLPDGERERLGARRRRPTVATRPRGGCPSSPRSSRPRAGRAGRAGRARRGRRARSRRCRPARPGRGRRPSRWGATDRRRWACGVWSSSAARFAVQTRPGRSSIEHAWMSESASSGTVSIQAGRWPGQRFSKNRSPPTPSGQPHHRERAVLEVGEHRRGDPACSNRPPDLW